MCKPLITILTPTYNRAYIIGNLYKSLCNQDKFNFEWLIIDDGSSDDIDNVVSKFYNKKFTIKYYKKPNTGKCDSLNYSHKYINGKLVFIVDSDDVLTDDATTLIAKYYTKYNDEKKIGCYSFLKQSPSGVSCSPEVNQNEVISDHIAFRINGNRGGDRAEVIYTHIFKQFPFPVYTGEKFMGEGWLWASISKLYKTLYINQAIYICEYRNDGLTRAGRKLRIENPYNMIENCKIFLSKDVCLRIRFKKTILMWIYCKFAGISVKDSYQLFKFKFESILCFLPSCVLYKIWLSKYL